MTVNIYWLHLNRPRVKVYYCNFCYIIRFFSLFFFFYLKRFKLLTQFLCWYTSVTIVCMDKDYISLAQYWVRSDCFIMLSKEICLLFKYSLNYFRTLKAEPWKSNIIEDVQWIFLWFVGLGNLYIRALRTIPKRRHNSYWTFCCVSFLLPSNHVMT